MHNSSTIKESTEFSMLDQPFSPCSSTGMRYQPISGCWYIGDDLLGPTTCNERFAVVWCTMARSGTRQLTNKFNIIFLSKSQFLARWRSYICFGYPKRCLSHGPSGSRNSPELCSESTLSHAKVQLLSFSRSEHLRTPGWNPGRGNQDQTKTFSS